MTRKVMDELIVMGWEKMKRMGLSVWERRRGGLLKKRYAGLVRVNELVWWFGSFFFSLIGDVVIKMFECWLLKAGLCTTREWCFCVKR